ncbi:hypothetical protein AEAC466_17800 [Asticcacaulis sp. AC466]|uniref:vWA domain-containing protein n=1 Tax=Asticcacaulis sp. AC466 TaxID=1282362 RepID=UPI0003C3FCE9|nr:TadE/TadG family protein [Asticcacaulis sp. AC466]ESQ82460.1 hypothetical protein AEAC466_17800 [Asticcacaulis sp. AC466]
MKSDRQIVSARFVEFFNLWRRDASGNVVMIFGLCAFVFMGFVGAAVDFSRASLAKRHLQDAADTAVLRTMAMTKASDAQLQVAADQTLHDNMKVHSDIYNVDGNLTKTVDRSSMTQTYVAQAVVTSYFGAFIGQKNYPIKVISTATVDLSTYEIAFVLDSTGSMAQSGKMPNLKNSVDSALKSLLDADGVNVTKSKVAIVPFNLQVRLDDSTLSEMTKDKLIQGGTGNCITDRSQTGSYDVSGEAANPGRWDSLYLRTDCAYGGVREVHALNADISKSRDFIKTLTPDGNTNITIGIQWGMEALSPNKPYTEGVAFSDPNIKKYMIVVTDGDNTESRWTADRAEIDKRTAKACQAAKDKGITVFTVKVIAGNSKMLRDCATEPGYFYDLTNAAQLNSTMSGIFKTIYKTRLTA